jgi:Myosin head (motor domain)
VPTLTHASIRCFRQVFVFKVKHSNKNHRSLLHEKLQLRTEFGVKHFAGPVTYDASKFVERNTDKLPDFLISVAATSSNGLIAQELSEIMKDSHAAFNIVKKKTTHRTVIDKFSRQLKDLLASIDHSQTRYIRCIKPCEDLGITKRMDHQTVLRQLKCAGLITAIELSRETFPNKLPFAAVERRFIHLLPSSKLLLIKDMELHDKAQIMMSILFSPFIEQYRDSEFAMPFACGHTKVYFRAGALEALEIQRQECFATAASRIQQSLRKAVKERQYHRARIGVGRLQALYRGQVLTLMYTRKRQSATKIQACTRSAIQRARFLLTKESAFVITTWCLVVLTQLQYKRIQHAAKKLNTWSRMQLARARFHRFVLSVSIIQATIRDRMQRKHSSEKIQAATVVADWWRAVLVRLRYIRTKNASILMTSWTRSRLLRNRFCRVKLAVTLLQANARSRRMSLMYHGNTQAAKTILCWSQAILACRRFRRMRAAAAKATVWTRARLHRARFIRRQEAATVLTAWSRSRQERRRFHRLTLAANVVCARRRSQLKSRLDQENCAAAKLQARVRTHQQMQRYKNLQWAAKTTQLLNQEHSAAAKLQAHVRTRQQMKRHKDLRRADLAKSRSNRDEHSAAVRLQGIVRTHQHMIRYHETLKASKSTPIAQSEKAREPRSPPMIRSEIEVPGARPGRVSGPINTSDCILVPMQLLEQVELYKRQVDDLNNDIMHVTAEAELHTQEVEADFEDRLAEYEEEVLQLKQTIRCYEEEKISFKDEIAANVENVRNLKTGIRSMQEAHRDYLNKVMRAIENANSEHLKALEAVKRDRDARVNALTAEINRLKKERRKSHDRGEEKRENDVYRLARKLEKLTSPDYITAMAEKSTLHSQPLEDYIEEKVSGKARKIIYRLEDIAAAAGTASSQDSMDGKERMQGLQQQLVIAYEEIERLQTEAGGARRHGDSLQKRGLRKIFDR